MTVLFVCTGNTCRSPMAEGLFNEAARRAGLQATALSCGLAARPGDAVTPEAVRAARAHGAAIARHTAVRISPELVAGAARIYGMSRGHLEALRTLFPEGAARMDTLDTTDIADPFGRGQEAYDLAARQIAAAVERLVTGADPIC